MTLVLYGFFVALSIFFLVRGLNKYAIYSPFLLVCAEFISGLQERNAGIIKISLFLYVFFLVAFIIWKGLAIKRNIPLFLFFIYVFIATFFSSDPEYSIDVMSYTIPGFLMFYVSSEVFMSSSRALNAFLATFPWIILMFAISFILGQLFQIGTSFDYGSSEYYIGGFIFNRLYSISLAIMLTPLFIKKMKFTYLYYVVMLIAIVGLVLSMRRTSFVSIALFFVVYLFLYGKQRLVRKALIYIFSMGLLLALTFPWYSSKLIERVEAREDTLEAGIREEGRIIETFGVLNKVFGFREPYHSFFGQEMFNSAGYYEISEKVVQRKIHNNFNMYLFCTGIVGFMIFIFHFVYFYKSIAPKLKRHSRLHYALFVSFFIVFILMNFSGTYGSLALIATQYSIFGAFYALATRFELTALNQLQNRMVEPLSPKTKDIGYPQES